MPKKKQTQDQLSKRAKPPTTDLGQLPVFAQRKEHPQQELEKDALDDLFDEEDPEEILKRLKGQIGGE